MYKIVALIGESGCGKDYAATNLCRLRDNKFHKVVMDTTRPPRDNEVDGIDYNFIDIGTFAGYVLEGSMLEATCFKNSWYYGTNIESLDEDKINIAVMNPEGVEIIKNNSNIKVKTILIQTDPRKRLIHTLNRSNSVDCHEVCRRFIADEEMFKYIDYNIAIMNSYGKDFIFRLLDKIEKIDW